jgi:hypothetical protein
VVSAVVICDQDPPSKGRVFAFIGCWKTQLQAVAPPGGYKALVFIGPLRHGLKAVPFQSRFMRWLLYYRSAEALRHPKSSTKANF